MKKLMIAAAIAMVAVASQAANVSWSILNVSEDSTALKEGKYYVFFATTAEALDTVRQNFIDAEGNKTQLATLAEAANWDGVKRATVDGSFTMGTNKKAGSQTLPKSSALGLTDAKSYYAMAVIFDKDTGIVDGNNYLITTTTEAATIIPEVDTAEAAFNIGSQAANTKWYAVANVPEPTSGLLLLIGVAGLALRRRRA